MLVLRRTFALSAPPALAGGRSAVWARVESAGVILAASEYWLVDPPWLRHPVTGRAWDWSVGLAYTLGQLREPSLVAAAVLSKGRLLFLLKGRRCEDGRGVVFPVVFDPGHATKPWTVLRGNATIGRLEIQKIHAVTDNVVFLCGTADGGASMHIDDFIDVDTAYRVDLAASRYETHGGKITADALSAPIVAIQGGTSTEGGSIRDGASSVAKLTSIFRDQLTGADQDLVRDLLSRPDEIRCARHENDILTMDAKREDVIEVRHYRLFWAAIPRLRFIGDSGQDLVYFAGGMARGHVFVIPPEGLILGRGPQSIPSARVSRRHVKIEPLDDGGLLLTELGATNETAVNAVAVQPGGSCRAKVGDRITLDRTIEFEVI